MTGKQKQPLYTCLKSKDRLALKRLLFVAGLLQGSRRENSTSQRWTDEKGKGKKTLPLL